MSLKMEIKNMCPNIIYLMYHFNQQKNIKCKLSDSVQVGMGPT